MMNKIKNVYTQDSRNGTHNAMSNKNSDNIHENDKVYVDCRNYDTIGGKIWKEIIKEM